ncbi:MAG: ribosome-binding factor A [Parcubacteria group bacterium]|nr:ribosome-binding factor A [Parcubacteria group bacterium]
MALPERKDLMAREIARAAGTFITLNSNRQSLITVTHADISPDFAQATIYVSVLPETMEKQALDFLKRSRGEFRSWVSEEMKLKRLPTFDFALDFGEKNRQAVQPL